MCAVPRKRKFPGHWRFREARGAQRDFGRWKYIARIFESSLTHHRIYQVNDLPAPWMHHIP